MLEAKHALAMIPSAFFSVSLSAAGSAEQRNDALRCMETFLGRTQFKPLASTIFAGAVKYRKYGFIKRFLMKRIVGLAGGGTDTSQDYEYTNWPEVSQFVERFLANAGLNVFSNPRSPTDQMPQPQALKTQDGGPPIRR